MDKDRILLVEDEEDTRYIFSYLLKKNNYELREANNGLEALELLKEFKPKVVIADWNMPKMNGIELCNSMRGNDEFKNIYFILITARASLRDKLKGLDVGADDFLVKPVENRELLARIRTGVRIFNLQSELKAIEHNKALKELTVTIGHKMNNPIGSLNLAVNEIISQLNEDQKEKLSDEIEIINGSIERMKKIIDVLKKIESPELIQYALDNQMLKLD